MAGFATMARYYFDTRDDETFVPDDVGVEIDSFDEVKLAASAAKPTSPRTYYPAPRSGTSRSRSATAPGRLPVWPFVSRSST